MPLSAFPIQEIPAPSRAVPIVLSIPHSGTCIPDAYRSLYKQDPDQLAYLGDLYIDALFAEAPALGITVIRSPYSRFLVDLNRFADDLSPDSVEGKHILSRTGYHGKRGVIWAVSPNGHPIYHRPLTAQEAKDRLDAFYVPYHDAIFGHMRRLRERFGYAILLDGHSMPSQPRHFPGKARADIVPGDLDGTSCSPLLSHFVQQWWQERDYTISPNYPYKGGAITRLHGQPHAQCHAIQLEFNRALYMDESTREYRPNFSVLQRDCLHFLEQLGQCDLNADCAAE